MKSLDDAIGCWTVNSEYNSLPTMARKVSIAASTCRWLTTAGKVERLALELGILQKRLETMLQLTIDAQRRLKEIIDTNELDRV
jgi:hypothetical protein